MYKIKEEGYEYKGYKLGQMTDKGMIIGFDTRENIYDFIATDSDSEDNGYGISESDYAHIILKGYKNSHFSWLSESELELIEENEKFKEIIPTMQTQLNVIQQIRKAINGHNVKLEFFQEEFCVSLYDSEIPICWDKQNGIHLLTETFSGNLTHDMMIEILDVMKIIDGNLEWFKECMQND